MKRVILVIGLVLLVFAGLWQFVLRNNFNQRFPAGWAWVVNSLAYSAFAPESGVFPEGTSTSDEPINVSFRQVTASTTNAPAGSIRILDHYETRDPITNAVSWQLDSEALVDPFTGKHIEGDLAGQYYFLPRNLDKTVTYTIANASYVNLPMSFQGEELINGINTYHYGYQGDFDNSAAYPPEFYPDLDLTGNLRAICFGMTLDYWVEPNTGELLKFREWCEGDYLVDTTTGERLRGLTRWGAETDGADLIRQANVVQGALFQYQMVNLYLPLGAAILGLLLLAFGAFGMKSSSNA